MPNKKYYFLVAQDIYKRMLEEKLTMKELAKIYIKEFGGETESIAGCIRYLLHKNYTPDQLAKLPQGKIFHKNKRFR